MLGRFLSGIAGVDYNNAGASKFHPVPHIIRSAVVKLCVPLGRVNGPEYSAVLHAAGGVSEPHSSGETSTKA